MKHILRVEEAFLFTRLDYHWWFLPVFLFTPDIGMIGCTANTGPGAVIYYLFHHKAVSIGIYISGAVFGLEWLQFDGLILFAHASLGQSIRLRTEIFLRFQTHSFKLSLLVEEYTLFQTGSK